VLITSACPTGRIPEWLQGTFLRLGPGKFDIGDFVMNHWFDGYAVLYKFDIQKGKVSLCLIGINSVSGEDRGVATFQRMAALVGCL
jgi:hypothetical protein